MSSVEAGSVMTAFRNVEPALKIVALWRSMIEEKRPAWGKRGEPSAITVLIPNASGAAIR